MARRATPSNRNGAAVFAEGLKRVVYSGLGNMRNLNKIDKGLSMNVQSGQITGTLYKQFNRPKKSSVFFKIGGWVCQFALGS